MGKKTFLLILLLSILELKALSQRVIFRISDNLNEAPTNYPIQIQNVGTNLIIPVGFTSNWTWTAYTLARPTFDTIWTNWQATNVSSVTFSTRTNLSGLQLRQTLLLSNINWFSTNMNVLNATLGASNLVLLRFVEERLKNP